MNGLAPGASAPGASLWLVTAALAPTGTYRAEAWAGEGATWLVEVAAPSRDPTSRPAPFGMVGGLPGATLAFPVVDETRGLAPIRVSDTGWTGEPDDTLAPHRAFPARMDGPPQVVRRIPLYWDGAPRAEITNADLSLHNADGAMDALAGDWRVAGQDVTLWRGPHRRPRHAPLAAFRQVVRLRVASVIDGTDRLTLRSKSAASELTAPACDTYAGTGGPEGGADLKGQPKPRWYGRRRNVEPVLEDGGRLIYRLHHGSRMRLVDGVRNLAAPAGLFMETSDYGTMRDAVVPNGAYVLCNNADGTWVRLGFTATLLTCGGTASDNASPWDIAAALLGGPGSLDADRIGAGDAWPTGEAGLFLRGGTVAEAMDRLATGVGGYWGADGFGRVRPGLVREPALSGASIMLDARNCTAPREEPLARPPVSRVRVGWQVLDRVQTAAEVAPAASAAIRDYYGAPARTVEAVSETIRALPSAQDGPKIDSVFDRQDDAQAMADRLLRQWGPRRVWTTTAHGDWTLWEPGAAALMTWPTIAALRGGRELLIRDIAGQGGRADLVLWG